MTASLTRRVGSFAVIVLAASCSTVVLAPSASAHDAVVATSPSSGTTVVVVPEAVVLTFTETPLTLGLAVRVLGPDGNDAGFGDPVVTADTVTQAIRPGAPGGTYTVRWRVTARDGHPTEGAFAFTARVAGGSLSTAMSGRHGVANGGVAPGLASASSLLWLATAGAGCLLLALGATSARRRRDDAEVAGPHQAHP